MALEHDARNEVILDDVLFGGVPRNARRRLGFPVMVSAMTRGIGLARAGEPSDRPVDRTKDLMQHRPHHGEAAIEKGQQEGERLHGQALLKMILNNGGY